MSLDSPILDYSRQQAEKNAIRLMAYSGAILPDPSGKIGDIAIQDIIETGVSFAFNARRCLENYGADPDISQRRWSYHLYGEVCVEKKLKKALNGIIHARNLRIHHAEAPESIFQEHSNGLFLHFVYETEKYPEKYVDIFGLSWAFLTLKLPSE